MKVLIISDAWKPQVNGVVRTYENLSEYLQNMGHKVKVIGPADFPFTIPTPGYSEIRLAIAPSRHLKKQIEGFEPDYIHISTEGPLGWAARKYCMKHNLDFTTSYHTHFPDYVAKRFAKYLPFTYKIVHKLAKKFVRKFHAPSKAMMIATQSLEEELKSWGFKTPMHRLTRGVKLDQFYPGENTAYTGLKQPIALYVGRIAIEKNLEAFLDMNWDGTKVLIGDGPSLQGLSKAYPDVIFTGKKEGEDLAAHYRSADVFVFPSRTDTFGIVLIEAMASGLPIAAYDVTGPKDLITEDFLGVIDDDLSKAAYQALECGTREERANYVKDLYTWNKAAKQFEIALTSNASASKAP